MNRSLSLLLWVAGAVVAETACSDPNSSFDTAHSCAADSDCGNSFLCVQGFCYDAASSSTSVFSFDVYSPGNSPPHAQQIVDVVPSRQGRTPISLPRTLNVRFIAHDELSSPLSGYLTLSTESKISSTQVTFSRRFEDDGQATIGLTAGLLYSARFFPDRADVVPFSPPLLFVNDDVAEPAHLVSLTPPPTSALIAIEGRVVATAGAINGVSDMNVALFLKDDFGGNLVAASTRATTDLFGHFSLTLPNNINSNLLLRISPVDVERPFPTISVEGISLDGPLSLGEVEIGEILPPTTISGTVSSAAGPLSGAVVLFSGTVGKGTLTLSCVTDASGRYRIDVAPGLFHVAARPPPDSQAGLLVQDEAVRIDAASSASDIDLFCPNRTPYSGHLIAFQGSFVAGASIRFSRTGGAESTAHAMNPIFEVFSTTSDAAGAFFAHLDTGRYQVEILPPFGTPAPRKKMAIDVGPTAVETDIFLDAPLAFGGRLVSYESEEGVQGARVRAYRIDTLGAHWIDEQYSTVDGLVDMIVPAAFESIGCPTECFATTRPSEP